MEVAVSDYLRRTLQSEHLLREPQLNTCRVSILFPVQNEPVRRVLDILESIIDQEAISLDEIEVLCLVNNEVDDQSGSYEKIRRANQLVMDLPIWQNGTAFSAMPFSEDVRRRAQYIHKRVRAYLIDKSSPGNEIPGCNIGRARNRLLAEAVHRFSRREKNGVIIMTDADVVFANPRYIRMVLDVFEENPIFIGGAGGIDLIFDPDTLNEKEREVLYQELSEYILLRRWMSLSNFLLGRPVDIAPPDACYGANIICRSNEAAGCGGFRPFQQHEDSYFLKDLSEYADIHGKVAGVLPHLRVNVALRSSFRTKASFGQILQNLRARPKVNHPLTGKTVLLSDRLYLQLTELVAHSSQGRALLRRLETLPQLLYDDAFSA